MLSLQLEPIFCVIYIYIHTVKSQIIHSPAKFWIILNIFFINGTLFGSKLTPEERKVKKNNLT